MRANYRIEESHVVGTYLCQLCNYKFAFTKGQLMCPKCLTKRPEDLVPIYVEDNGEPQELYSKIDWHGGD